jgi:hypothetical protein
MAVTRTFAAGPEQFFQQIDRVIKSHSLRGSESLCKLLQYLAKQALEHPDAPLKEYQIATEVYGRKPDFDPQSDSTIRVQAGRLRLKLAEYYATEGTDDPIVVKVPKGSYHLVFEPRADAQQPQIVPAREPSGPVVAGQTVPATQGVPASWRIAVVALLACLIIAVVILASLLRTRKLAEAATGSTQTARAEKGPLAEFWKPFSTGAEGPWVIFSNAAFVGRPETGMRYYNARQDSKTTVYDHYTGVGEVLAVHALDEVFAALGRQIRVKRGSLFSLDDASNTNLIFVGSPSENLSLLDISATQEFVFQRVASGPRKGDLAIVSRHPKQGEATSYLASPSSAPLTEDYAVVGLVPGVIPDRFVMILAGTTTFGTQGAVEFVSRADSVKKLLQEMPGSANGMRPFEALVRVKIARGVPLDTELVALRLR